MFLVYKRGLERNGNLPVFLHGYGGFNLSMLPFYAPIVLLWAKLGGVFALPNLRGGSGEYGQAWYEAGIRLKKQNVFDDFISAAEWLISQGYTQSSKIATMGNSNGGLLVSACLVQRPDLFGCCISLSWGSGYVALPSLYDRLGLYR